MKNKERIPAIIRLLRDEYPASRTALKFKTPFQLLIATILSAQCTDKRVNIVTKELFGKYPAPDDLAIANMHELEQCIRSTGFYRQKAKNIKNSSIVIIEKFNSQVPHTMEELITLPGVGRKTANVVLSSAYGISKGIAVDTHVKRLSYRLGLSDHTDPVKIELDLMELTPKAEWNDLSLRLILHGRSICKARVPKHDMCVLKHLCPKKDTV
ncbi:MAG: endonuclease III [Euryarchaeota archaeon]|nr:endonuclease III [Euryarchaeota archaeon]